MASKKRFLLFLFIIFAIPLCYADFTIDFTPVKDKLDMNEEGIINLSIANELDIIEEYKIANLNFPTWDIYTMPIQNPLIIKAYPQKTTITTLYIKPLHVYITGSYKVQVNIENKRTKEKKDLFVPLVVTELVDTEYTPAVIVHADIPKEIDPRNPIPIRIKLENKNVLSMNITLTITSELFYKEQQLRLGPLETKNIEIVQQFDPLTPPQKDSVVVSILRDGVSIGSDITKRIEIVPYSEIKRDIAEKKGFLKTSKSVTFRNIGNIVYEGNLKMETNLFKSLFTYSNPKSHLEDGSLTWNARLEPDAEYKISVVENFRILIVAIAVVVAMVILYFIYRTPLILIKNFSNLVTKEGGISNLKIVLVLRNRGSKRVDNIEIVDKIPHLIEIEKGISIGTITPKQILKHEKHGTFLKWHIDKLDPGEERVLNYKIRSSLSILGELNLPAAMARFKQNDKTKLSHSNTLTVSH